MKTKMSIQIAVNINGGELIYDEGESICLSLKEAWGYATDHYYQWGYELTAAYECLMSGFGQGRRDITKGQWKTEWGKYRKYYSLENHYEDQ